MALGGGACGNEEGLWTSLRVPLRTIMALRRASETSVDHYEKGTWWISKRGHKRKYRETFHPLEIQILKHAHLRISRLSLISFHFGLFLLRSMQMHPCEPLVTATASCTHQYPRRAGPLTAVPCLSWSDRDTCCWRPASLLTSHSHRATKGGGLRQAGWLRETACRQTDVDPHRSADTVLFYRGTQADGDMIRYTSDK